MEQVINYSLTQPIDFAYDPAVDVRNIDDNWIMKELFGIRSLEQRVNRALGNCAGNVNDSLYSMVAELNARVSSFDQILDISAAKASRKPVARAIHSRAS